MVELQKIRVLYEDNHLLVVEKPVNMPVCEDSSGDKDLLNWLKGYIKEKYKKPGQVYLGLVHRLDRPVGGVMVFARTSKASSRLSQQIRKGEMAKRYYAVVEGVVDDEGELVDYLVKDRKRNISYVTGSDEGKYSVLSYRRVGVEKGFSLVDISLGTGRSHQIRVQFASRWFPLVDDVKYNSKSKGKGSVALFAYGLEFNHPVTKERLCFRLDVPKRYPFNLFRK